MPEKQELLWRAAQCGHDWSVFLNFKGGKELHFFASSDALSRHKCILFVIGIIIIAITRYVSLAYNSCCLLPVLLIIWGYDWKVL